MAVAGLAAGLSAASGVVGTVVSTIGAFTQADAQKKVENLRQAQMNLEASRARREQIRRSQVAVAASKASAWSQGAGASSALSGGVSQIMNEAQRNQVAINQDQTIANGIYSANKDAASGQMMQALGGGISSLGGAVANGAGTIARLGYGTNFGSIFGKKMNAY